MVLQTKGSSTNFLVKTNTKNKDVKNNKKGVKNRQDNAKIEQKNKKLFSIWFLNKTRQRNHEK